MNRAVVVDTDILIDFFRGHKSAIQFLNQHSDQILLSTVVIAELFAGIRNENEKTIINQFISAFPSIDITEDIAIQAGLLKRQYGKSHGVGIANAIIAATALKENAELKTLNAKHFPMFSNIKPASRK